MKKMIYILIFIVIAIAMFFFVKSCAPEIFNSCNEQRPEYCENWKPSVVDTGVDSIPNGPYELCPHDKKATIRPIFDEIEIRENELNQQQLYARFGVFGNEDLEIFTMEVLGQSKEAVQRYTDEVVVCADAVFLNTKTIVDDSKFSSESNEKLPEELIAANEENLIIELDFVSKAGFGTNENLNTFLTRNIKNFREPIQYPIGTELPRFLSLGSIFNSPNADHALDFIIDPTIKRKGVVHDYYSKCTGSARVNTTAKSKSVSSYLYFMDYINPKKTGSISQNVTKEVSRYNGYGRYDFSVKAGEDMSKYRLSGRFKTGSKYQNSWNVSGYSGKCL